MTACTIELTMPTGARSCTGSYPSFWANGAIETAPTLQTQNVYPSGAALATYCVPTMPPAPTRFSTTTGLPKVFSTYRAVSRPTRSV